MENGIPDESKLITLTAYLRPFEAPDFSCGDLTYEKGAIPYPVYNEMTKRFMRDCLDSGMLLMQPTGSAETEFPAAWDDLVMKLKEQPEAFETASLEDLSIYLTVTFLFESFWPLTLFTEFTEGRIVLMLRRLRQILGDS